MNDKNRSLMIFSPILVVGLGFLTATIAVRLFNEWAWVPLAIIYWSTMAFILYRHKRTTFTSWLQKPKGHKGWIILAFSVSLLPLPAFIFGWHTLDSG